MITREHLEQFGYRVLEVDEHPGVGIDFTYTGGPIGGRQAFGLSRERTFGAGIIVGQLRDVPAAERTDFLLQLLELNLAPVQAKVSAYVAEEAPEEADRRVVFIVETTMILVQADVPQEDFNARMRELNVFAEAAAQKFPVVQ